MSATQVLLRASARQAVLMGALALVLGAGLTAYALAQRDLYRSSATAAYDQRDALGLPVALPGASRFAQIAATLRVRLSEPEFLWQVARAVELNLDAKDDAPLADDSSTKSRVAKLLRPTFRIAVDKAGQTLTLSVIAEDPLTARRLADAAMELFIQKELRFEAENYHRLYEAYARYLDEVRQERSAVPGPPVLAKPALPLPDPDLEAEFLPQLEQRVLELDLERRRLTAQIDRPSERTRLRLSVPATYDDVPVKHTRRRAALGLGFTALLLVIGAGVARELTTPFAANAYRVTQAIKVPVLAEVPRSVLRHFPEISRDRAVTLRESAKHEGARGPAARAWHAYQGVDRAVSRVAVGPVVLFAVSGTKGGTRGFVHNLLCVTALDATGTRLVIDGEIRDPLVTAKEARRPEGDLGQFLAGKVAWKAVRMTRSSERPYDLVFASPSDGSGKTPYSRPLLAKLFTSLCRGYSRVFIRAHELRHEVENAVLADAATDCILIADGRTTRLAELEKARDILGAGKVRGVILLGT